ncbi:hypothetical protein Tco_0738316 [Tanacetum coccineum]
MDDPNITMEEYIMLEEEKAHRHGKVYNWETATYGKIWYDEDIHDLRSDETEFPAIVYYNALTSKVTPSYEPTVSPLNDNKIDFRISFDESDDEDYMETSEEVDNVGGVFINLEISKCWSLEISRRLFNILFAQTLKMENHPEQNIRGVLLDFKTFPFGWESLETANDEYLMDLAWRNMFN